MISLLLLTQFITLGVIIKMFSQEDVRNLVNMVAANTSITSAAIQALAATRAAYDQATAQIAAANPTIDFSPLTNLSSTLSQSDASLAQAITQNTIVTQPTISNVPATVSNTGAPTATPANAGPLAPAVAGGVAAPTAPGPAVAQNSATGTTSGTVTGTTTGGVDALGSLHDTDGGGVSTNPNTGTVPTSSNATPMAASKSNYPGSKSGK